jgi:hypothetical protein
VPLEKGGTEKSHEKSEPDQKEYPENDERDHANIPTQM